MSKAPKSGPRAWGKFYWGDWENDPALATCSMGAQGLWMRLLCIASRAGGSVLIGGKRPSMEDLAHLTRQRVEDVEAWVAELTARGVCSLTQGRVIYSRRMREDLEKFQEARENGRLGGNPNLVPARENPPPPTPQGVNPEAEAEAEAEFSLQPAAPAGAAKASPAWEKDGDFVKAWGACTAQMRTRSESRDKTWPTWKRAAAKAGGGVVLLAALQRYLAEDVDIRRGNGGPGFHLWLGKGRWEHWIKAPAAPAKDWSDARWRAAVVNWQDTGEWGDAIGPPPDAASTIVPSAVLAACGIRRADPPSADVIRLRAAP